MAKTSNHATYRAMVESGDLTWRAGWPDSAENFFQLLEQLIYQTDFDTPIALAVRNRKSFEETMEISELSNEIEQIDELWDKENEKTTDRQKGIPDPEGGGEEDAPTGGEAAVENEHLPADVSEDHMDRLKRFQVYAKKLVATHVTLIVEPASEALLAKAINDSKAGQARGVRRLDETGQEPCC